MAAFTRSLPADARAERHDVAARLPWWRTVNARALAAFLVVCQGVGLVDAWFTDTGSGSWWDRLDKPSFTPPGTAFPIVWASLDVLMAYGAWRVWRRIGPEPDRSRALLVFGVQLLLNGLWAPVFFGAQSAELGMLVIAALWLAVLAMVLTFAPVDPLAAALNVPYLGWVTFAAFLNGAFLPIW